MKKIIKSVEWAFFDGVAHYRPVYVDGAVGFWTPVELETSDPFYLEKIRRIAEKIEEEINAEAQ